MKEWIEQLKERLKKLNERMESFTNSENGRRLRITGDVLWNLGLIFIIGHQHFFKCTASLHIYLK